MVLADINLGDVILSMLWFFFIFMWIWVFIAVFTDLFRDHELGGFAKVLWVLGIIFFPFAGILVYLIARGRGMSERSLQASARAQAQFDDYVRQTASAGSGSTADELAKLADLRANGTITEEEFASMKAKIVS
jgi:Short C-terminal domain/Phospholipase_D-nuclease N-terminal